MKIFRAVLECAAPLHCGGGEDARLDQPVARDAFGLWRAPGSTLAGAMRHLGEELDKELGQSLTAAMFGDQDRERSVPSLIWCEDLLLLDFDSTPALLKILEGGQPAIQCPPLVRDHVRIDLENGAGEDGGKFDMEIAPAGARFLFQIRCDGWNRELTRPEEEYFDRLCGLILAGNLELGGKSGLGYGKYRILSHECLDLKLDTRAGMEAWLNYDSFALPPSEASPPETPAPALYRAPDRLSGSIEIPLLCAGPILIGGGRPDGETDNEADIIFALTPFLRYKNDAHDRGGLEWRPILPASSIRGILRHAIYDIMKGLRIAPKTIKTILEDIFGHVSSFEAKCGKISFNDAPILTRPGKDAFATVQHVALDRFSAAPVEGALFNERPIWLPGAETTVKLEARDLEAHEAALLWHALLDLCEGSLAIGSGVNRGNGRLKLQFWDEDRRKAFMRLSGDMSWNGRKIIQDGASGLRDLAPLWDKALREKAGI